MESCLVDNDREELLSSAVRVMNGLRAGGSCDGEYLADMIDVLCCEWAASSNVLMKAGEVASRTPEHQAVFEEIMTTVLSEIGRVVN